jgi:hypothetical protein
MSVKLTDTQLLMLSAAAQRDDRCIAAPPSLKGTAAQKIAAKLVAGDWPRRSKQDSAPTFGGATKRPDRLTR